MKAYISSSSSISSQNTFDKSTYLKEWNDVETEYFQALEPSYRDLIDPKLSRRMSRVIKMAVAASSSALDEAKINTPEAIIVGTGLGCIADTIRFLKNINETEEGTLSPTSFIQSTHNTVGGQIALLKECPGYNFTHSNRGFSFENALVDSFLQLEDGLDNVLVGAADELTTESFEILQKIGCANKINSENKIGYSEGASFFLLSKNQGQTNVGIKDLRTFNYLTPEEFEASIIDFLRNNKLKLGNIDLVLSGQNHVDKDLNYRQLESLVNDDIEIIHYKPYCGEFLTASAFGLHLGYMILRYRDLIDQSIVNIESNKMIKNILIYNNYNNINHSLILVSSI